MFECQVELLSLIEEDGETIYFLVGRYSFDPGLQIGEEVWINCEVGGEIFSLKTQVKEHKKEIYPPGSHSRNKNKVFFCSEFLLKPKIGRECWQFKTF